MPVRISKNRVSLENLPLNECLSTVASATTPDIWTNTCNVINYTGTATATGFATAPQAGARRTLVCAGAAVFTAGANMLIDGVSSGNNFTAATGDKIHVIAVTTTQFRLTPAKYDGTAVVSSTSTNKKVGVFTRDISLASGTQAVTGLGFQPDVVIFMAALNTTTDTVSLGADGASGTGVIFQRGTSWLGSGSYSIQLETTAGTNYYSGYIFSRDSDGFTLSWTKTGSPTGTASITYTALKL